MNFSDIEDIYRSRVTLLDILDERGYDTALFRKFSPLEIAKALGTGADGFTSLSFTAKKLEATDEKVCKVEYLKLSRQKLPNYFDEYPDITKADTIVMMMEPVLEIHHQLALTLFLTKKIYVSFFSVDHLVNNPVKHFLVPKHEIMPTEEEADFMKKYHIVAKNKMPLIRYHWDPIVRIIGAVPGNIIKITRPSQTAGENIYYRCVSA
jgi:DNA-directed RNA polymerase subunit H (RpoH/RPB5)